MLRRLTSKISLIILIIVIVLVAGFIYIYKKGNNQTGKVTYPEYMNFDGNYVFSSPKDYTIDEHSLEGTVLVFKQPIQAVTAADVINNGGMSVEPIRDLTDHSDKAFKNYVKNNLVPQIEKNLSTNNVKVKFSRWNGQITAELTVDNGNKPYRWAKGGQHPAVVTTAKEDSNAQVIEQTLTDVEKSDLGGKINSIKSLLENTVKQLKTQKAHDLYTNASSDLQAKTSETQISSAIQNAVPYINGNITISGVSYSPSDLSVRMKMVKLDKNDQAPAFGSLSFKNINSQWQLQGLTLPTPKQ